MASHFAAAAVVLMGCCAAAASSLVSLRGGQGQLGELVPDAAGPGKEECEHLAKVSHLQAWPLSSWNQSARTALPSFSCHVAPSADGAAAADGGGAATCSPVCTEPLDIVVVLGASEWSLEQSDISHARSSAMDLLKHFELSRSRGSLFGFLDVSHGAGKPQRVSPLSDDRSALEKALQAWSPQAGGKAVTSVEMQGFDERPEVLAMLDISRPSVRRTLLVLQPPPKQPKGDAPKSHLGLVDVSSDPFKRDKEIMELLVSACPAIRIDPNLKCGRMRWGVAEDNSQDKKIKPWGK